MQNIINGQTILSHLQLKWSMMRQFSHSRSLPNLIICVLKLLSDGIFNGCPKFTYNKNIFYLRTILNGVKIKRLYMKSEYAT